MLNSWQRATLQTVVTKLDTHAMTFAEAKKAAESTLGRKLEARTSRLLVREMFAEPEPTATLF